VAINSAKIRHLTAIMPGQEEEEYRGFIRYICNQAVLTALS